MTIKHFLVAGMAAAVASAAGPETLLKGRVTDASGSPLADAVVVVNSENGGLSQRRITGENGVYLFENLSPSASYTVRISKPGFRTVEATDVTVKRDTTLNHQLGVPSPARSVSTAAASEEDNTAPVELKQLLRKTLEPHWADARPREALFDYSAPAGRTDETQTARPRVEPLETASAAPIGIRVRLN